MEGRVAMANPICHWDLMVNDLAKAKQFYGRVFDWRFDEGAFPGYLTIDTGGGIPAEDLNRVFTRLYRADNVLIQGVGDTGVGLSIARTLTEAIMWHGGESAASKNAFAALPMVDRHAILSFLGSL